MALFTKSAAEYLSVVMSADLTKTALHITWKSYSVKQSLYSLQPKPVTCGLRCQMVLSLSEHRAQRHMQHAKCGNIFWKKNIMTNAWMLSAKAFNVLEPYAKPLA